MTTERRPTSGRAQSNTASKLDAYNKASKKAAVGTNMRTFSRTKVSNLISSWDDVHYFTVKGQYFKFINDSSGNVDSASTLTAQAENLLNLAWETNFQNANLKDLVAADEASWKLYYGAMIQICLDFQIMYNMRCYLPAYTESDIVPGVGNAISYFSQSSFDIFLASMSQFPVPKGVYEIVDLFATWVVKLTQEYERFTLRIPAAIYQPFTAVFDLADYEALQDLLRVNLGGFVTHAQKYGMKTGAWRDPIKPTEKLTSDPDVIAYFNHCPFKYYDNQPAQVIFYPNGGFLGTNLTTNFTDVEYMFKDTPNESQMHVYAPWFGLYNATNNAYGGFILQLDANTAEYYVNLIFTKQHGTTMAYANLGDATLVDVILLLHKCASDNVAATLKLEFGGTNFTAVKGLDDTWPIATHFLLYLGKGRGATETINDLINLFGRNLR